MNITPNNYVYVVYDEFLAQYADGVYLVSFKYDKLDLEAVAAGWKLLKGLVEKEQNVIISTNKNNQRFTNNLINNTFTYIFVIERDIGAEEWCKREETKEDESI